MEELERRLNDQRRAICEEFETQQQQLVRRLDEHQQNTCRKLEKLEVQGKEGNELLRDSGYKLDRITEHLGEIRTSLVDMAKNQITAVALEEKFKTYDAIRETKSASSWSQLHTNITTWLTQALRKNGTGENMKPGSWLKKNAVSIFLALLVAGQLIFSIAAGYYKDNAAMLNSVDIKIENQIKGLRKDLGLEKKPVGAATNYSFNETTVNSAPGAKASNL